MCIYPQIGTKFINSKFSMEKIFLKYFTLRELNGIFKRNYKPESQLAIYLR